MAMSVFNKIHFEIAVLLCEDACDYTYILTLECELTIFIEAYPLRTKKASSVAKAFVKELI